MLLPLSCIGNCVVFAVEGEVEKEGRWVCDTELSARDLSCSDQLKPPPSPVVPGLPPPLTVRRACAPNDIRRVKGVVGALRPGPSSSSIAFSSIESEPAVETLPRRPPNVNGADCVGDVPDKPSVERDMRRRWSCAAAVVIGPGKGAVGAPDVLLERPKMLLNVWLVKLPRRGLGGESVGGLLSLLADIVRFGFG
jgi:hypothetical protein